MQPTFSSKRNSVENESKDSAGKGTLTSKKKNLQDIQDRLNKLSDHFVKTQSLDTSK